MRLHRLFCVLVVVLLSCTALLAQQTGAISGTVTATDGSALPGVTVEARSNLLPQPRVTTTDSSGSYRLPALIPGSYTVQFSLGGMQTVTRKADVLLGQKTVADAKLGLAGVSESITVTAEVSLVDKASTELKSALSSEQIQAIPLGQEYRDLIKLIPGVQVTNDAVRGPSAGGSGVDNVYNLDGANVTWPLFGVLAAEPATHDIAQVNVVKGGAKALDFDRAGGFTIDSVSKSGTNKLSGELSYQTRLSSMSSKLKAGSNSIYDEDRSWATLNLGGPILSERLFFYGSYYRPLRKRQNRANLYGELPEYKSTRNEEFGKLTITPTGAWLINTSYRKSKRRDRSNLFGAAQAPTSGSGDQVWLDIANVETSWIVNSKSFATFKATGFKNRYLSTPDNIANVSIATARGTQLDINNLDKLGNLSVPILIAGQTAYNAFAQPIIDRYGYVQNGVRSGGGTAGFNAGYNDQTFRRRGGQIGYNMTLGSAMTHDLHVGYQRFTDAEDLFRFSNGWGSLTVPGGRINCPASACGVATPAFYQAAFQQQSTGAVPVIHSEYKSQNFEINDTMHWGNWSFNAGVLASNDTLYGSGLEKADNLAGFVSSPGTKYKMYDIPFRKMIQPRLGTTWAYNGSDTVYVSYSVYNPSASSLPRAASWDRNIARTINAYFDATGKLIGVEPVASSSGKLFMPDMKPRTIREYLVGTGQQLNNRWSARAYGRYRHGDHFWEDVNNDARVRFNPPSGIPRELYMADLQARRLAIGRGTPSGDTYVIADLDGAFTKYYEATMESDWRGNKTFFKGSYTWSHYYGNFDQDNTSAGNDDALFIGSSNLADSAGRQIWDFKYGDLRGDRRHMLKLYGAYTLPWNASAGALTYYQSGQPWETWNYEPYRSLTTSVNETIRFAEPAGSRRTPAHWQADLNYTQNFAFASRYGLQMAVDWFNIFNKQTRYNIEPRAHNAIYGQPRNYWDPRRFQVALRLMF